MLGGVVEGTTTIDFSLVDYNQMFRFIMMEEVMMLAVLNCGGGENFIGLDLLRAESNIRLYFEKVVQRPVWMDEDFAIFFDSRSDDLTTIPKLAWYACGRNSSSLPTHFSVHGTLARSQPQYPEPQSPRQVRSFWRFCQWKALSLCWTLSVHHHLRKGGRVLS
jgi:hypothetical protein